MSHNAKSINAMIQLQEEFNQHQEFITQFHDFEYFELQDLLDLLQKIDWEHAYRHVDKFFDTMGERMRDIQQKNKLSYKIRQVKNKISNKTRQVEDSVGKASSSCTYAVGQVCSCADQSIQTCSNKFCDISNCCVHRTWQSLSCDNIRVCSALCICGICITGAILFAMAVL